MENLRQLSKTEIILSFAASCVESVARAMSVTYIEAYNKMKEANLFDDMIFPHYEAMHTESRDTVTQRIIECLESK